MSVILRRLSPSIMQPTNRIAAAAATLVMLAAPLALAQQGSSIHGTVTNAQTRAPISGARVAIATPERIAITDDRGTYILRDVPAGTYKVYTSAIGRAPDSSSVSVSAGASATHDVSLRDGSLLL